MIHPHIHVPAKLRHLVAAFLVLMISFSYLIWKNSLSKNKYEHTTGKLTYLSSTLGNLPYRDSGLYRYIKVENYPYPFEVYTDKQGPAVDSLKIGDTVTAYYYETDNTREVKVNRFLNFLDKSNHSYFKRTDFLATFCYGVLVFLFLMICGSYWLYKKGKIPY